MEKQNGTGPPLPADATLREQELIAQNRELRAELEQVRELGSFQGFYQAFYRELKDETITHKQAFERVSERFKEYFGYEKFTSFESFRVARDYHNKKPR